jgi:hypothetical protein
VGEHRVKHRRPDPREYYFKKYESGLDPDPRRKKIKKKICPFCGNV